MEIQIPCLKDLDLNCPADCPLYPVALKKILILANRLTVKKGEIVSIEKAIAELRKMSPNQIIVHNARIAQLLQENNRLDDCPNSRGHV